MSAWFKTSSVTVPAPYFMFSITNPADQRWHVQEWWMAPKTGSSQGWSHSSRSRSGKSFQFRGERVGLGMMVSHIPPPMIIFAVTMGVNYDKRKKGGDAGKENDNNGIMSPYPSQKSHCVLIHCQYRYRIYHARKWLSASTGAHGVTRPTRIARRKARALTRPMKLFARCAGKKAAGIVASSGPLKQSCSKTKQGCGGQFSG
jgi:hypothetical protein